MKEFVEKALLVEHPVFSHGGVPHILVDFIVHMVESSFDRWAKRMAECHDKAAEDEALLAPLELQARSALAGERLAAFGAILAWACYPDIDAAASIVPAST